MRTKRALIGFVPLLLLLLLTGCLPTQVALPDPTIPHRVARETVVLVWVRRRDGKLVQEPVRVMPGWWVAGPQVVE